MWLCVKPYSRVSYLKNKMKSKLKSNCFKINNVNREILTAKWKTKEKQNLSIECQTERYFGSTFAMML